jgi:hypothetical protein
MALMGRRKWWRWTTTETVAASGGGGRRKGIDNLISSLFIVDIIIFTSNRSEHSDSPWCEPITHLFSEMRKKHAALFTTPQRSSAAFLAGKKTSPFFWKKHRTRKNSSVS